MKAQKTYDVFKQVTRLDGSIAMRMVASLNTRFQGKKALARTRRKGHLARLMIGTDLS